jgi:microcin C transport system permease protein
MNLWSYIAKRILLMIPTLLGVIAITFAVIQFVPGGPVEQVLIELKKGQTGAGESSGAGASEYRGRQGIDSERVAEIKALYGFDKPPAERFWLMLQGFAKFDLGQSFYHHKDVWELVKSKLPVSITIGLWTFFLTYFISIPLGVAKAVRAGSRFDSLTSMLVLIGYSIPGFVLGVFLLVVFAGSSFVQWFPLRGLTSDDWDSLSWFGKTIDYLWHITLPVTASVAGSFAVMTMLTKNTFLEEIRKQYVLTARAKGLSSRDINLKHVLRAAMTPIVTVFGLDLGSLLGGAVITEYVFNIPGLGKLSTEAVTNLDLPVVTGTVLFAAFFIITANIIVDLLYSALDPKVRLT